MFRALPRIVALLGVTALGAAACTSLLGDFSLTSTTATGTGGGTGTGGATGTSSTTGTGGGSSVTSGSGGAGGLFCSDSGDCAFLVEDCLAASCSPGGACITEEVAEAVSPKQTAGDCQLRLCDVSGNLSISSFDEDLPDDGNPCTLDGCQAGTPTFAAAPIGTACADPAKPKGHHCDQDGACVECTQDDHCPTLSCRKGVCDPAHCVDGAKDGGEPDVDCGGECAPCADGNGCFTGQDCVNLVCDPGLHSCAPATCSDGLKNGSETDQDCGGEKCKGCANGKGCNAPSDCGSNACAAGVCVPPSCSDGTQNGLETDVDCGGPTCLGCTAAKGCMGNGDCLSGNCISFVCQ